MSRRFLASFFFFATWAALAILTPAFGAGTVFPPGLRVGMEPPGDLKPSTNFPGFEDVDRKVSVTILDLPAGAYAEIERAASAKDQSGLTDVKREDFSFTDGKGVLMGAQAERDGVKLHKWILLATVPADKIPDLAMLINVEVPEAASAVYSEAVIRKALASVTFRPMPIEEQLGMLPFKIDQLAGFRVMKALPSGGAILTDGPTDDLSKQPYVIVSVGRGSPEAPGDRGKFARDLLSSAPLRDLSVESAEPMRIGGAPGFEIRAQGKGLNGEDISLVQWVRFGGGVFLRIVGVGRKDEWDALFTRFRAVRDGVDTK
jgi:hypothetical protein